MGRGVRFNLLDVKLHADSIHRGMGQIQPPARRVFFSSVMTGACRLVEPVFKALIEAPGEAQAGVMQALGGCRGELVLAEDLPGGRLSVQAYVPVAETIGASPFATVLSQKTNGRAFVNYRFDHWETVPSDPLSVDKNKKPLTKEYFFQSMFNAVLYGWTPEVFPAPIRGTACGVASFWGRLFGIIAPLTAQQLLPSTRDAEVSD